MNRRNESHGMAGTRIYKIWVGMKNRCSSQKYSGYANYGGRGIKVCTEWENSFCEFYNWAMANGYREDISENGYNKLSIDRIDNDGNYEPSNCRWATAKEQALNQRKHKMSNRNTSGFIGVNFSRGTWRAYITVDKKKIHIGRYDNKEDAIEARKEAELIYRNPDGNKVKRLTIPAGEINGSGYQLKFKGKTYWESDNNIISKAIVKLGQLEDKDEAG